MASKSVIVREVWEENVEYEFFLIGKIIKRFPYASMDTEFPGVIHPPPLFHDGKLQPLSSHQAYNFMKENVNDTKLIQLGLTLSDATGNLPDFGGKYSYIWEFNFREFDVDDKAHQNESSIELLKRQGIDFEKNRKNGIEAKHFAWLFRSSALMCSCYPTPVGFVFTGKVTWVTFHGSYDFGYLLKILKQRNLPNTLLEFMEDMKMYVGDSVYDIKHMVRYCDGLYGGLEKIAKSLQVTRVTGKSHQAGSDSLLIMQTFMKLKETYVHGRGLDWYGCKLFGLDIV